MKKIKFRPTEGSPYKQQDVNIIGPALVQIADELKVDVPQLTTRAVKRIIEQDQANPLWGFIDRSPKKAMDAWIRKQIGQLIRAVRYERVDIQKLTPQPLFEDVRDTSLKGSGGTGRAKVNAIDAHDKPGIAARIADAKVLRIRQAAVALRDWLVGAPVAKHYTVLSHRLTTALGDFDRATDTDVAAE